MKIYSFVFDELGLKYSYYKGEGLLRDKYPFFLPSKEEEYWAYPSLVVRIGRTGKKVAPEFAHRYIKEIGCGFELVAPQQLKELQEAGLPWDKAVAFENAATAGAFFQDFSIEIPFLLSYNKEGEESHLLQVTEQEIRLSIASFSERNVIHIGDLLFIRNKQVVPIQLRLEDKLHIKRQEWEDFDFLFRIK